MSRLFWTVLLVLLCAWALPAQAQETIQEYTEGMEKQGGYFPLYWDGEEGRLLLEVPRPGEEFLYMTSLATGVGSTGPIVDRGEVGDEYIARFVRTGPKISLVLQNPEFRARSDNEALARSVRASFPTSIVGTFEILAEEEERLLVDATSFFLRDAMGVRGQLKRAEQGTFELDADRSMIYRPRTKAFPENTEVEATLTFTSEEPGSVIRRHAPDGRSLTLREHHSFVKLPGPGYNPRPFDPRIGFFYVSFYDFSKPFDAGGYATRYAIRHRLEKQHPDAAMSEPVEPIVYYLDPAIPEPYRTAFKEGARWFNDLFEAAGFIDAFQIRDMPPDMDPMDARYNVILWVHRTEPSSSYGTSFVDPRTGEIIKGVARMDSYRSLVDYNIYAGVRPAIEGIPDVTAEAFTMARRRQHAAHEVGHTLGLAHNFITSSYGRASVMDYPPPLIKLENGRIDLTDAYRDGPGAYDSLAIRWGYTPFPEGGEEAGLEAIIDEAQERGLKFITNPDQASSSSYPNASTWVTGREPIDELERVMEVRRFLIDHFDETALRPGEPMWTLNERFAPVYLHHRYALGAATKVIGGMTFRYAVRGDALEPTQIVAPERQRRALELLLDALEPEALAVPERVLALMAPRPFGYAPEERDFSSNAGPAVDQIGMARTLAEMVVGGILHPERAARVVAFAARDPALPTLEAVIGRMIERTWQASPDGEHPVLQRAVQRVVLDELIQLAADEEAAVEARAGAAWGLHRIAEVIEQRAPATPSEAAHLQLAAADIQRFLNRPAPATERSEPLPAPPGTPIGEPAQHF